MLCLAQFYDCHIRVETLFRLLIFWAERRLASSISANEIINCNFVELLLLSFYLVYQNLFYARICLKRVNQSITLSLLLKQSTQAPRSSSPAGNDSTVVVTRAIIHEEGGPYDAIEVLADNRGNFSGMDSGR